ncbi:hypothetical protein IRJ41_014818, partial [Triplophysa rosa]
YLPATKPKEEEFFLTQSVTCKNNNEDVIMKTDYKHLLCTKRKLRNKEKVRDHDRGDNKRIKRAREIGQEDTDRPEGADIQGAADVFRFVESEAEEKREAAELFFTC